MRNLTPQMGTALGKPSITTAWMARLDFAYETLGVWTGPYTIAPTGTDDDLLEGVTFAPINNGIVVSVGDNSYSYSGSEQLDIVCGIPAGASAGINAATTLPAEWQTRPVTIWRAILIRPADPLAAPYFQYKRIRTGAMDGLQKSSDGQSIQFKLTIESHASLISNPSGMTYENQPSLDPNDTSQQYARSIANGTGFQANISANAAAVAGQSTYGDMDG